MCESGRECKEQGRSEKRGHYDVKESIEATGDLQARNHRQHKGSKTRQDTVLSDFQDKNDRTDCSTFERSEVKRQFRERERKEG